MRAIFAVRVKPEGGPRPAPGRCLEGSCLRQVLDELALLGPQPRRLARGGVLPRVLRVPGRGDHSVDPLVRERPLEQGLRPGRDPEVAERGERLRRRRIRQPGLVAQRPHRDHRDVELRCEREQLLLALTLERVEGNLEDGEPASPQRTRELPERFGEASGRIKAYSDAAFRGLVDRVLGVYRERLFNAHWGEQIRFAPDNTVRIGMVFQGLTRQQAEVAWQPLVQWMATGPQDLGWEAPLSIVDLPARQFWDAATLGRLAPQRIVLDDRRDARPGEFFWAGNRNEAGQFFHGYHSAWLPATLLDDDRLAELADALFAGSRHWGIALQFNKALAGAPEADRMAARDTAMNPVVVDAFALVVVAAEGPPAYADIPGDGPDLTAARRVASAVRRAFDEIVKLGPARGSYVSESDFFERSWQDAFWGSNHARLATVKRTYDPNGLFVSHHAVGSEAWSEDGFTRLES